MPPESRAEYFQNRRSKFKIFSVEVEREKMDGEVGMITDLLYAAEPACASS